MRNETTAPIFAALDTKTTEELKKHAVALVSSKEEGATMAFVAALTILEERLTSEEYDTFIHSDLWAQQEIKNKVS